MSCPEIPATSPRLPRPHTQRGTSHQHGFFTHTGHRVYLDHPAAHLPDAGARLLAFCLGSSHTHLIAIPAHEDSLAAPSPAGALTRFQNISFPWIQ